MLTAAQARSKAKDTKLQQKVNFVDEVVELMEKIDKSVDKAASEGKLTCTVSCIKQYGIRDKNGVWGWYYPNFIINEIKKRLKNSGYDVKIERKKKRELEDYSYKDLIISWK